MASRSTQNINPNNITNKHMTLKNLIEKTKSGQDNIPLAIRVDDQDGRTFDWPVTGIIFDETCQRLVLVSSDLTTKVK